MSRCYAYCVFANTWVLDDEPCTDIFSALSLTMNEWIELIMQLFTHSLYPPCAYEWTVLLCLVSHWHSVRWSHSLHHCSHIDPSSHSIPFHICLPISPSLFHIPFHFVIPKLFDCFKFAIFEWPLTRNASSLPLCISMHYSLPLAFVLPSIPPFTYCLSCSSSFTLLFFISYFG